MARFLHKQDGKGKHRIVDNDETQYNNDYVLTRQYDVEMLVLTLNQMDARIQELEDLEYKELDFNE